MIRENIQLIQENIFLESTLKEIRTIELENTKNIFFRNFVLKQFGSEPDKVKSVWQFVINNFTYKDDDYDETLIAPKWLLFIKKGDCDDFALFIKTCYNILNIPAYYMIAGKNENEFSHIVVITESGLIVDGTNNKFNYLSNEYINRKIII